MQFKFIPSPRDGSMGGGTPFFFKKRRCAYHLVKDTQKFGKMGQNCIKSVKNYMFQQFLSLSRPTQLVKMFRPPPPCTKRYPYMPCNKGLRTDRCTIYVYVQYMFIYNKVYSMIITCTVVNDSLVQTTKQKGLECRLYKDCK